MYSTGPNGLPDAVNTFPSVHAIKSAGNASALLVGFDNGKMIGRALNEAISRTIDSVNAPACVDVPIKIVGRARDTTVANPTPPAPAGHPATSARDRAYGTWKSNNDGSSSTNNPCLANA